MILHFNNTTLEVQPNDSSYRYRSLMAKPQLVLKFSLPRYVEIPVGAYCDYMGERYFLNAPQNIKKQGTRHIEYTLNMGTRQDNMALYKMRNSVDKRLKYSMCAKPHEFIAEIVANLNERDGAGVWSIGTCIDANEKTIEFNHTNIGSALSQVAETFETEWEIVGTTIHLHKVEYYKSDPLPLSYGKGNGFMPGVGRTTPSNELPIKRLYVQGGDRNIDRSKYNNAPNLLLPKSQSIGYDGTYFSDEVGYDATKGHIYTSDADGYYIERTDVVSDAVKEDSLDCSSHYPSRIGKVTSVIAVKPAKNFYDFIDNTIPTALNINDYIIEGETPTIIFQTGMLSGEKEFEFKYKHSERRFELVPQEIDGQTMPNATFIPKAWVYDGSGHVVEEGDTYAIFGIMLPDSYICDNTNKEGASWDMMREAVKHLWENENQKFTFTGTLQSLYAKRNWINIGGKLIVGGFVHFSDTQFVPDGVDIRITGIKDFLTSPYSPTVEISNNVTGQSLTSKLREIDSQEVIIEENHKDALQFTRRRFRDAQESLSMLEDAFDNFSGSVNPVTVQTMAMLVGDESLQFQFVTAIDSATIDSSFQVTYDAVNKQLSVPHSFLRHMTLGIDTIKSSHSIDEYKTWEMTAYVSARLEDGSKKYYLYAKVDTAAAQNGEFLLSETPIDMERVSDYYHLLVGVLNSELDEQRSFVSLYGFTEILPARITTDKIVSADGQSYIDLLTGGMKLGSKLLYQNGVLTLDFLFSNGANIGGWIFRNNRLESQNGMMYLDGVHGGARLGGTLLMSTGYGGHEHLEDYNIFYLQGVSQTTTIVVNSGVEHIGKVIKVINTGTFSQGDYRIRLTNFSVTEDEGGSMTSISTNYEAVLRPQEVLEASCFQRPSTDGSVKGSWEITSRFSQTDFKADSGVRGRYALILGQGRYSAHEGQFTGHWWNNLPMSSILSISRVSEGVYRMGFSTSNIPSGSHFMVCGFGGVDGTGAGNAVFANVYNVVFDGDSSYVEIRVADDSSLNDAGFEFIVFGIDWSYTLHD